MDFRLYIWPHYVLKWNGQEAQLSDIEGAILSRLFSSPADLPTLIDSVHGHREDGGPISAANGIAVALHRLRKKIAGAPIKVGHVSQGSYYLIHKARKTLDGIADSVLDD